MLNQILKNPHFSSKKRRISKIENSRNDEKIKEDYWKEFKSEPPKLLTKGYSSINFVEPYPKLLLSKDNFNMMVEGYHFNITSAGKIIFKNVLW